VHRSAHKVHASPIRALVVLVLCRTAAARDVSPPDWRSLQRLSFSEFMTALRTGGAASVEVWSDRDPGVYWPPPPFHQPFAGKRALVTRTDGTRAWAELPIPELEVRAPRRAACAALCGLPRACGFVVWRLARVLHKTAGNTRCCTPLTLAPIALHPVAEGGQRRAGCFRGRRAVQLPPAARP
jgi:hypothetical protein